LTCGTTVRADLRGITAERSRFVSRLAAELLEHHACAG